MPEGGTPVYDRETQVRAILAQEDSDFGRVYRYDQEVPVPAEMAEAEGNQEVAFVYSYRLQIAALLSDEVLRSPWAARSVAASDGVLGIYADTYPHHIAHRIDAVTGRTLLKLGHSTKDANYRVNSASGLTALPEDPAVLGIYPTADSAA